MHLIFLILGSLKLRLAKSELQSSNELYSALHTNIPNTIVAGDDAGIQSGSSPAVPTIDKPEETSVPTIDNPQETSATEIGPIAITIISIIVILILSFAIIGLYTLQRNQIQSKAYDEETLRKHQIIISSIFISETLNLAVDIGPTLENLVVSQLKSDNTSLGFDESIFTSEGSRSIANRKFPTLTVDTLNCNNWSEELTPLRSCSVYFDESIVTSEGSRSIANRKIPTLTVDTLKCNNSSEELTPLRSCSVYFDESIVTSKVNREIPILTVDTGPSLKALVSYQLTTDNYSSEELTPLRSSSVYFEDMIGFYE
jgi:hypothetical protein